MVRREPPYPAQGSDVDIESLWQTRVGEADVDLDDGPATSFRVPPPPTYVVQDSVEKLASVMVERLDYIINQLHWFQRVLIWCVWAVAFGFLTALLASLIKC
jgi:hypothetical protein